MRYRYRCGGRLRATAAKERMRNYLLALYLDKDEAGDSNGVHRQVRESPQRARAFHKGSCNREACIRHHCANALHRTNSVSYISLKGA